MTLQEKLRRLTETANLAAVAWKAGMSPQNLSNYLVRGSSPLAGTAVKLARALGVDVGWLLSDEMGWPPVRVESPAPPAPSVRESVAA